jgi:hypothetical protein
MSVAAFGNLGAVEMKRDSKTQVERDVSRPLESRSFAIALAIGHLA